MKIIYNNVDGSIVDVINEDQNIEIYYQFYPKDYVKNLRELFVETYPHDIQNYTIRDGKFIKRSPLEIGELEIYNRILTDEERLLNKLKPSIDEIRKAENTIEILTLIQEVI